MMIASGYTGQTIENFATNYAPGSVGLVGGFVPANPIIDPAHNSRAQAA
jgi:hypothetical protein